MIDTESFDIFDITIEVLRNKAFLALVAFCLSVFCCGKNYIIPSTFDPRLISGIPAAVAKAAMSSGVARKKIDNLDKQMNALETFQGNLLKQALGLSKRSRSTALLSALNVTRIKDYVLKSTHSLMYRIFRMNYPVRDICSLYIASYIKSKGASVAEAQKNIDCINVRLSSRVSGFVDKQQQKYLLDSKNPSSASASVFIPPENIYILVLPTKPT